jgi:hypothetical protein
MKSIDALTTRLLRGPRASRFLKALGIDARRYWLLMDSFGELSERGEMLDQLGRNGVALKVIAWWYGAFFGLFSILMVLARVPLASYSSPFLIVTALFLLAILLSETGNSLVNPVEGLVLAAQPTNGATYTAAKLTHLLRIILYLATAMNAVPALAGLGLKQSSWSYPFLHLLASLAVGIVARLFRGQPSRAGYELVSHMTRRDFQFRRLAAQIVVFGFISSQFDPARPTQMIKSESGGPFRAPLASYSSRRADIGSSRAARRAGIRMAARETLMRIAGTDINVTTSVGSMP